MCISLPLSCCLRFLGPDILEGGGAGEALGITNICLANNSCWFTRSSCSVTTNKPIGFTDHIIKI